MSHYQVQRYDTYTRDLQNDGVVLQRKKGFSNSLARNLGLSSNLPMNPRKNHTVIRCKLFVGYAKLTI